MIPRKLQQTSEAILREHVASCSETHIFERVDGLGRELFADEAERSAFDWLYLKGNIIDNLSRQIVQIDTRHLTRPQDDEKKSVIDGGVRVDVSSGITTERSGEART